MTVKNLRHLNMLADRLESETDANPLRVSLYLRTLNIAYPHYDFQLEKAEGVDHRFQSLAPMLTHLESLRVSARIDEDVSNLVRYFQACPRLHKVSLAPIYNHFEFENPLVEEMLYFTNMTDLNITWHANGLHALGIPEPLINAINNSPDLARLELWLCWGWNFPDFLSELIPLPNLDYPRIGDEPNIYWEELTEEPYSHPMYLFFSQHHIREVHFETYRYRYQPELALSPALLHSMFPSLQCFTGPLTIIPSVVSSPLAQQLRELCILIENDIYEDRDDAMEVLDIIRSPLPNLEKIEFLAIEGWPLTETEITALERMLRLVPNAQSLSLGPFTFQTNNIAALLRCVIPQLREITLATFGKAPTPNSRSQFVEVAAVALAGACRELKSIEVRYVAGGNILARPRHLLDGSIAIEYNGNVCTFNMNL